MPVLRHARSVNDAFEPPPLDAGWLRVLLRHAVRCSLASSLALSACADNPEHSTPSDPAPGVAGAPGAGGTSGSGGAAGATPPGDATTPMLADAGPVAPRLLAAGCEQPDGWQLAPGFHLAHTVDYVADRRGASKGEVGTPCATAQDRERCQSALVVPEAKALGYHLVTTEGDDVRFWTASSALVLLGDIDTMAEAVSLVMLNHYSVVCDAAIGEAGGKFSVAASRGQGCSPQVYVTALVSSDGTIEETAVQEDMGPRCVDGRRPEGLRSVHRSRNSAQLGEHFAAMAHMEAASVPAFAAIANELHSYGAPAALVLGATRASRDEVRHARVTAALAQRFGVQAVAPVVERMPLRSLEAFALDNAIEGCVNETYAAAEVTHRAACAGDPLIRRELCSIAADETRHAELSWAIARWVMPALDRGARARIRAAQSAAVAALGEQLRAYVDPELCTRAGVPNARAACALHASLARTLWRA